MQRASFLVRVVGAGLCIAAFPENPAAPMLLAGGSILFAAGYSAGTLATNERLFRMVSGPSIIACQGKFVARNSIAQSAGSAFTAAALALSQSYPVYAGLFAGSAATRIVASVAMKVSPSWHSASAVGSGTISEPKSVAGSVGA
jgi:hypothetical protein